MPVTNPHSGVSHLICKSGVSNKVQNCFDGADMPITNPLTIVSNSIYECVFTCTDVGQNAMT